MPQKRKHFDPLYLFVGLIFLSLFVASIYFFVTRNNDAFELKTQPYDLSGKCSLSLCDCRCYPTEELPEIRDTKICGNDCFGRLGIKGCIMTNNTCELVLKQK